MRLFLTLLVCAIIAICSVSGQEGEPPYSKWFEMLPTKKDVRGEKYRSVELALHDIDTARFCDVFARLKSNATAGNERLEIRLMNLEAGFKTLQLIPLNCSGPLQSEEHYL